MTAGQALRSGLAVAAGMIFITVGVEALEWTLVTAINQAPTRDPEVYYGIRNGAIFLAVKVLYNTAGAMAGGYLTARLAGRAELLHGLALAIIQGAALSWAAFQPDLSRWAPPWLFPTLAAVSVAGILYGAHLAAGRRLRAEGVDPGPGRTSSG